MNTLKEILVDAARYRWLRERALSVYMPNEAWIGISGEFLDENIDEALTLDN